MVIDIHYVTTASLANGLFCYRTHVSLEITKQLLSNPRHLKNGQLENRHLENKEYSTWPSPEGAFSIWSSSKSFL